jgi:hypothetical protein
VDINYDNTSSDDWDSVIFDQNGVGTTLATISANSTATVNVPSPGTLMIVGAQLSNQIRPGVTALTTFGSVSVAVPGSCTPPTNVDTLAVGELLASGQFKHDIGNAYSLVMQPDGNLVEYSAAGAVWSSATSGHPGAFAALQADGNFVIYNQAGTQALWASNHFSGAVASLVVQGDGNVVEYTGGGAPIWYTGVPIAPVTGDTLFPNSAPQKLLVGQALHSASGGYVLVMQSDGNLVAYSPTKAIWSSSTSGAGASFVMQTDGNAVLYSNGKPVWSTGTYGHPGSVLVMQPDGNVVVYSPSGQPLWASGLPH